MSYESPITLITEQLRMKCEDDILKVVQEYGIKVDKEELEKALRYDRDQYRKGYADGYNDGYDASKWKPAKILHPDDSGFYLVCAKDEVGNCFIKTAYYTSFGWGNLNVTHWQPLPALPKEVEDEMQY